MSSGDVPDVIKGHGRPTEVVYLRFFADLTQDEIAKRMGISQMHVSRILRGALEQMRRADMD